MEFVVATALKPSLRSEFVFQQTLGGGEELICFNANTVVGGGDDFSVDDLLDLSNGEERDELQEELEELEVEKENSSLSSHSLSLSLSEEDSNSNSNSNSNFNSTDASHDSIFSTELLAPTDDVAELEWVSHFVDVDDSFPEFSLLYPVQIKTNTWLPENEQCSAKKTLRFPSETKITTKARTVKNRRNSNPRVWSFSPLLFPSTPLVSGEPASKKQKRKAEAQAIEGQAQARRCTHCHVQKTPQWRTGPLGAKTLCNACGVRFKSGRLCSEYRPACSPTFCSDIHSNSHRKVMEIRRRKEMVGPESGLPAQSQTVQIY